MPHDGEMGWIEFAYDDLRVSRLTLKEGICHMACFHAQQAAEKSLKALLKEKINEIPRIHNLSELYKRCLKVESEIAPLKEACQYLDRFYAPTRYPDAFPGSLPERLPNEEEAKKAIEHAQRIYDRVSDLLHPKVVSDEKAEQ